MTLIRFINIFLLLTTLQVANAQEPVIHPTSISYYVDQPFDEAKENLVMAIEDKGAVISYTAHSSAMLNRTAITLEIDQDIYEKAEILLFCKAELSHEMVRADPHSLVLCPYPISLYSLKGKPNRTYLTIRKPPQALKEYQAVHTLLTSIILDVVEG